MGDDDFRAVDEVSPVAHDFDITTARSTSNLHNIGIIDANVTDWRIWSSQYVERLNIWGNRRMQPGVGFLGGWQMFAVVRQPFRSRLFDFRPWRAWKTCM
jgi:hypothetical protein